MSTEPTAPALPAKTPYMLEMEEAQRTDAGFLRWLADNTFQNFPPTRERLTAIAASMTADTSTPTAPALVDAELWGVYKHDGTLRRVEHHKREAEHWRSVWSRPGKEFRVERVVVAPAAPPAPAVLAEEEREAIASLIYKAHGQVYERRPFSGGAAIPFADLINRKRRGFLATADAVLALLRPAPSQPMEESGEVEQEREEAAAWFEKIASALSRSSRSDAVRAIYDAPATACDNFLLAASVLRASAPAQPADDLHARVTAFLTTLREAHADMHLIYTRGSCYRLYLLLRQVFEGATAYTNINHVITKIGERFYDIGGEVQQAEGYREMDAAAHAIQAPHRADVFILSPGKGGGEEPRWVDGYGCSVCDNADDPCPACFRLAEVERALAAVTAELRNLRPGAGQGAPAPRSPAGKGGRRVETVGRITPCDRAPQCVSGEPRS